MSWRRRRLAAIKRRKGWRGQFQSGTPRGDASIAKLRCRSRRRLSWCSKTMTRPGALAYAHAAARTKAKSRSWRVSMCGGRIRACARAHRGRRDDCLRSSEMTTQSTITIIPAQAGWFLFRLYGDGSFDYDPIIAWEVESSAWDNRRQTSAPLNSPRSNDMVINHVFKPLTIMDIDTPWVIK